jgi:hypothetical protein
VRKFILKTYDFVDISNTAISATLGGSTTTSPPIVVMILRHQLDYVIVDYAAPTAPHQIKAKFFSTKSRLLFYLLPHPTLEGSTMNNHLAYHRLRKIAKALVAGVPCRILVNLVYSRMKLN